MNFGYFKYILDHFNTHSVAAPDRCSWQGIDRSLVASARAVKILLSYNFIITTFDCQGGGISARASLPYFSLTLTLCVTLHIVAALIYAIDD